MMQTLECVFIILIAALIYLYLKNTVKIVCIYIYIYFLIYIKSFILYGYTIKR